MSDGINHQTSMDPMELWRQWNETTSKMWSTVLERGKEDPVDPYGLYQLWLKNVAEAQEQLKADPLSMTNPLDIWKQWFDATTEVWSKSAELSNDSLALSTQWLKIVEEARNKILSGEIRSTDPFTFLKQWYDATSETWSQVVGEVISSERFMEANRKFIETYTSAVRMSHRVNEEALKNLQIPTRSDIARVAELVVSLEEKVDTIEDVLEDFEGSYAKMATGEAVESLGGRLEQVESKLSALDILPTALEKIEALGGLGGRLDRVESKLSTLDTLPTALEKIEALGGLEGRLEQVESKLSILDTLPSALKKIEALRGLEGHLDRVENKLDTLLLALEKIGNRVPPDTTTSRGRKAQKKNQESQEAKDTKLGIESAKDNL